MDAPTGILVEIKGSGLLGREEAIMVAFAERQGIAVARASEKQVERKRIRLSPGVVAVGSVPFVRHALRQLGKDLPAHTPYPASLGHLLYRQVRKLPSLNEALALLRAGHRLFIKPADGWKRFTGFVAEFEDDYRFNGASRSKPVWACDPVRFISEWRAYVADGIILEVRFADHGGDRGEAPDLAVIRQAVALLAAHADTPAGYVIDFGVLESGKTALIEMNDGFSFGAYDGVAAETYWKVTVRRWQELTA
ncbi:MULTISPECIES: ATP-grasp domain-containing protein [Cupriavidus]|jgi:ATP-grasp domain, R2K clade family 3|uniref:ATP-grasp domain-containing protein n=1 Tax=Cupriavidus TaxID=106589 RepID=UPI000466692C|nr:ATP-grasp domain-containing protein [Cupriavidus metallidurans]KWW32410.1 hypothetical protein AU374_06010 [Cupriavidus metallidurans]